MTDRTTPELVGWVIGLVGLLAAGSVHPNANEGGPLDGAFGGAVMCIPTRGSTEFSHIVAVFRNTDDQPAEITDVLPIGAEGLRLTEAVLVPVGYTSNGTSSSWPPESAVEWEHRQDAIGGRIPPLSTAGKTERGESRVWNLVLHLTRTDTRGAARLEGARIDYRVGRRGFYTMSTFDLHLKTKCF